MFPPRNLFHRSLNICSIGEISLCFTNNFGLAVFLVVVKKYKTIERKKKEGIFLANSLKVQSTMLGQSWWQEIEAVGYVTPAIRKERGMHARF